MVFTIIDFKGLIIRMKAGVRVRSYNGIEATMRIFFVILTRIAAVFNDNESANRPRKGKTNTRKFGPTSPFFTNPIYNGNHIENMENIA